MYYNNQSTIYIAKISSCHLVRDIGIKKVICILFTLKAKKSTNILTKIALPTVLSSLYNKLDMINVRAPTLRKFLD